MTKLKDFEPARYIDSEVAAQAYLELAKHSGDEALLIAATNDVSNARKRWLDHRPDGVSVSAHKTSPSP
ncbi:hypothetical protein B9Z45_12595 [Limnohabitans sp. 2KL-17]|uniref:hypothetical protein n=1 Tax=Limnohabitans sp. 2KL-17 TaxID=1100704 RepID=UPI000D3989A4|nr:hypothetical protein [Limnohabitans sp. 2KL-17]PUE53547.1 hypothetical protein B9Z45_12595 [Limnohabitans sp. 2KL-17]